MKGWDYFGLGVLLGFGVSAGIYVLGGMGGVGGYLVIASVDIENDVGQVTNGK